MKNKRFSMDVMDLIKDDYKDLIVINNDFDDDDDDDDDEININNEYKYEGIA